MPTNPFRADDLEVGGPIPRARYDWKMDALGAVYPVELTDADLRQPRLPIVRLADVTPQLTGLWLVKRFLPAQGIAALYGHPGCGKSFLALDLGLHIALGWDWHGRKTRQGLVVYVAAEGGNGLRNRITAFVREHEVADAPFALVPTTIDLQADGADVNSLAEAIRSEAAHFDAPPALIVVDTLSKTFGAGKENTDDMAAYVRNCQRLATEFEACVLLVHHRPKDSESQELRGHGSLKGGIETTILVEAGPVKSARTIKQKDGEEGEELLFKLKPVELGVDEDGETVTSCIVEQADCAASPSIDPFVRSVGRLRGANRLVYDQLGELIASTGVDVPASIPEAEINRHRVGKVASLSDWRDKSISAAGTEAGHNRDTGKRTFNRALTTLRNAGIVRVWEDWCWITYQLNHQPGQYRDNYRDRGGTAGQAGQGSLDPVPLSRSSSGAHDDDLDPLASPWTAGR